MQIAKNTGTVTIGHFARVLNYLGIMVSPDDFHLIIKKFKKDSYTVNYVAFVSYIDRITKNMDEKMYLDLGGVRYHAVIFHRTKLAFADTAVCCILNLE